MKTVKFASASLLAGMVTASLLLPTAFAEDWPRWGGNDPGRNMYSPATGLPDHFNVGKYKANSEEVDMSTTKNVKWAAQLGSQAFGTPVTFSANGRQYVAVAAGGGMNGSSLALHRDVDQPAGSNMVYVFALPQ